MSSLLLRNVRINGRRTSVRLERAMWEALEEICEREGVKVHQICGRVAENMAGGGFTSGLRVFIVDYFRDRRPWVPAAGARQAIEQATRRSRLRRAATWAAAVSQHEQQEQGQRRE